MRANFGRSVGPDLGPYFLQVINRQQKSPVKQRTYVYISSKTDLSNY